MPRGNPDNLRTAAQRKRTDATGRAEKAINALVRDGAPVNLRTVARLAGCSPDFLYRTPGLRHRIQQLRQQPPARSPAPDQPERSTSNVVRELTAQLADDAAAARRSPRLRRRSPPPTASSYKLRRQFAADHRHTAAQER